MRDRPRGWGAQGAAAVCEEMKNNLLLYLAFGPDSYHQEAVFSIVSALSRARETPDFEFDIAVVTDRAAPYSQLPVRIRILDAATLESWSGPHRYHFRAKHMALLSALTEDAGTRKCIILMDSDTFFRASPRALFERVRPGALLCNKIKGEFADDPGGKLYRTLHRPLEARQLAADDMPLVNSGVIGLAGTEHALLERSVELMDELFHDAERANTLEEFVLAVAAYERDFELEECSALIHHYWSRKRLFRAKIQAWLGKHQEAPLTPVALNDIAAVSEHLPRPPRVRRFANKLASHILPKRQRQFSLELLYGCYEYANEFDRACGPIWWEKAFANARQRWNVSNAELDRWLEGRRLRALLRHDAHHVREHLKRFLK